MAQPVVKTSFASGEWAPKLRSRVDVQKYHAGASLLRNFYVDYSGGGASTRQGTKYVNTVGNSAKAVRLIPFTPSQTLSYVLEFGDQYIRFHTNGATVLSGGVPYQINSPFAAGDLFPNPITGNPGLKYVQDVTSLIITHPSYPPQILTNITATNWTLTAINFAPTISTPTNLAIVSTDTGGTTWFYGYLITAVDSNGQESTPTTPVTFAGTNYIGDNTNRIANTLTWTGVSGAMSYNIYKASPTFKTTIPAGAQYGFIANVTGTSFLDSFPGIGPNFAQTPPITENPFQGSGVASYTVTVAGNYTTVPTVTVAAPPAGGTQATATAQLGIIGTPTINNPGSSYSVGDILTPSPAAGGGGFILKVLTIGVLGSITSVSVVYAGSITSGSTPTNPVSVSDNTPGSPATGANFNITWGVTQVNVIQNGSGYVTAPAVTFSAGAAAATAVLGTASGGNPGVCGFIQQRLALGGLSSAPQQFNLSQPGSFFNFNTSNPTLASDAVQASIISEQLNNLKSFVAIPAGLLAMTGGPPWVINGGGGISTQSPITPADVTASPQAFNGANDLRPIKINYDILYGTNRGSYIRDLTYNIYANIFTGSDITVLSNHLFFNYYLVDWAWAEEPLKTLWAIRSDGTMLSLSYVKEQDLIGWAHHDTSGQFKSVVSLTEISGNNVVDATYVVVSRFINGAQVQFVERMADRYFTNGYEDSWSVDAGLQTTANTSPTTTLTITGNVSAVGNTLTLTDASSSPFTAAMATNNWLVRDGFGGIYTITVFTNASTVTATVKRVPTTFNQYSNSAFPVIGYGIWQPVTTITGLTHLIGATVTGVADGAVVPNSVVSGGGAVTLATAASKVTLGLAFTPQLQTLPLDTGEPTIQSKRKKVPACTLRVADTLGLSIGTTFPNVVAMKDLVIGAIPSLSNGIVSVTDLFNGDVRTVLDQVWQEVGLICIQQNSPYPATILGVFPELAVGDTPK